MTIQFPSSLVTLSPRVMLQGAGDPDALENVIPSQLPDGVGIGLPDTRIQVVSPTARTNETVNNPSGWNLPDLRLAQSNAVTTVADTRVTYLDGSGFVSVGNRPDGLHYNPAGHAEYEAARAANPPPTP